MQTLQHIPEGASLVLISSFRAFQVFSIIFTLFAVLSLWLSFFISIFSPYLETSLPFQSKKELLTKHEGVLSSS